MARIVVKNGHEEDTCYNEIGRAQHISTILGSIVNNTIGRTSYNFDLLPKLYGQNCLWSSYYPQYSHIPQWLGACNSLFRPAPSRYKLEEPHNLDFGSESSASIRFHFHSILLICVKWVFPEVNGWFF